MPLPRKEIAIKLLELYKERRKLETPDESTQNVVGTLYNMGVKAAKRMAGQVGDDYYIGAIKEFVDRFETLDSFEKCITLIYELGSTANEAANQKIKWLQGTLTDSESLFCKTLHALRDLTLTTLRNSPEFSGRLIEVIKKLLKEKAELEEKADDRLSYNGDITDENERINLLLYKLSFLGHVPSIRLASRSGLFDNYAHVKNQPYNMVICLQHDYLSKHFYVYEVRNKIAPTYDEFKENVCKQPPKQPTQATASTSPQEPVLEEINNDNDDNNQPPPPQSEDIPSILRPS